MMHPGISAKEVKVEFSSTSPFSGYTEVGNFILQKGREHQDFRIKKSKARWVRLSIVSNHGNPDFAELIEFEAWGTVSLQVFQILSHLTWILGISTILITFSYYVYLSQNKRKDSKKELKLYSLKKPFFLGFSLVALGIILSIKNILLVIIVSVLVSLYMLITLFKRTIKKRDF